MLLPIFTYAHVPPFIIFYCSYFQCEMERSGGILNHNVGFIFPRWLQNRWKLYSQARNLNLDVQLNYRAFNLNKQLMSS